MQLRGDLRVPLERHDQGADLVVFPVADLLEGEGLRPQAVHLRPDRVDRLAEVRGVHARRDRPHPSGRARVEARERVVRQALLVPQVPAEAAVQPDPAEEEVREVQGVVVRVASGTPGAPIAMSTWVLCGIGIDSDPGRWGGGGEIAGDPPSSPRSRESGAAIASSRRVRSTSPVAARISPSGPTCASWNETMSARRIRRTRASPPFGSRPYGWSFGNTRRDNWRNARARVSSASMRRSFRSSPRTRSISFGGKVGLEGDPNRYRAVSPARPPGHRPWTERG